MNILKEDKKMKEKNCPNCGSPYNPFLSTCPYCGTSYFDLTSLDLTNKEPVFLKLKTLIDNKPIEITLFVRPELKFIEINTGTEYAYGGPYYNLKSAITTNPSIIPVLTLTGLPFGNDNKELMRISLA